MTPSELSDLLWAQVDRVAPHLLPNGKKEGHEWVAGNVNGDKGDSLKVNLSGKKNGLISLRETAVTCLICGWPVGE
ncbi:hypothetical protein AI04_22240 [Salmonella enterica subsp. enterica serovar Tennessee]|nr:hypothetical protein AI04_22240 [Salmonella enterica subsp. enterica serovar Tennessee]